MSLSQHQWLEPKDLTGFVHFFELLAKVYDEEELHQTGCLIWMRRVYQQLKMASQRLLLNVVNDDLVQ